MENSNTLQHFIHHPLKEHTRFMPPFQLTSSKAVRTVQIFTRHILNILHSRAQCAFLLRHLIFTLLFSPTHSLSSTSRIHPNTIPITMAGCLFFTHASFPTSHNSHTPHHLHALHKPHTHPTRRNHRFASLDCSAKNSSVPREWAVRVAPECRVEFGTTNLHPCETPPATTLDPSHCTYAVQHRYHLLRDVVLTVHAVVCPSAAQQHARGHHLVDQSALPFNTPIALTFGPPTTTT